MLRCWSISRHPKPLMLLSFTCSVLGPRWRAPLPGNLSSPICYRLSSFQTTHDFPTLRDSFVPHPLEGYRISSLHRVDGQRTYLYNVAARCVLLQSDDVKTFSHPFSGYMESARSTCCFGIPLLCRT
ncbi:hypothetical protein SCLCIDRAFT_698363 [Scleroderma citrinum Foug A]|uniref:Uncharacterized protein n=1 Tax=Scleroderma citrinum Foug A TaxID=1036808 RepID=A0A0C3EMF0_9AGAM|nr:hypothetical protein SCLCIDRAFT_698363 [Scleroderma citrinum Foug A]